MLEFRVNEHTVPVPLHGPSVQPTKVEPAPGASVSVIGVPPPKLAVHPAPLPVQLIPGGDEVMVPWIGPTSVTTETVRTKEVKDRVTVVTFSGVNVQVVPVPEQPPPLQPPNPVPAFVDWVKVTWVPPTKVALHSPIVLPLLYPQLIPPTDDTTPPRPAPVKARTNELLKLAVAVLLTLSVRTQGAAPEQSPVHPSNQPLPGPVAAVRVTCCPTGKLAVQVPE